MKASGFVLLIDAVEGVSGDRFYVRRELSR
jgi:hypothetical protein